MSFISKFFKVIKTAVFNTLFSNMTLFLCFLFSSLHCCCHLQNQLKEKKKRGQLYSWKIHIAENQVFRTNTDVEWAKLCSLVSSHNEKHWLVTALWIGGLLSGNVNSHKDWGNSAAEPTSFLCFIEQGSSMSHRWPCGPVILWANMEYIKNSICLCYN